MPSLTLISAVAGTAPLSARLTFSDKVQFDDVTAEELAGRVAGVGEREWLRDALLRWVKHRRDNGASLASLANTTISFSIVNNQLVLTIA